MTVTAHTSPSPTPYATDDDSNITHFHSCWNYLGIFKNPNAWISLLEMI